MSGRFGALAAQVVGRRLVLTSGEVACVVRVSAAGMRVRTFVGQRELTVTHEDVERWLS